MGFEAGSSIFSKRIFWVSLFFLGVSVVLGITFGAASELEWQTAFDIRGPRVLLALAVGAGLALSGATLQALFANPLCDPYTLGVSSGAALGAVIAAAGGGGGGLAQVSSFLGAVSFSALLFLFASRRMSDSKGLLIVGVMLGFVGQGLVTLWLSLQDPGTSQQVLGWLFGDLSRATWSNAWASFVVIVLLSIRVGWSQKKLDAFLLGEDDASNMGIDVRRFRRNHLLLCSLLVSVCVGTSGMIGFLGFLIPHFVRSRVGVLHGSVLPLSWIWGAIALVLADLLARRIASPFELPVGALTAVMGAPLFAVALLRPDGKSGI